MIFREINCQSMISNQNLGIINAMINWFNNQLSFVIKLSLRLTFIGFCRINGKELTKYQNYSLIKFE